MMNPTQTYTVSELNRKIRSILEGRFSFIQVTGEVSGLRRPYSGHLYFTLKDANAQLKAVLFKMQQRYLSQPLEDGNNVTCRGRITVYEPRGDYQLLVDSIDFAGTGDLQLAYEQLKRKLAAEGLFSEALKRKLPRFPEQIALITSPGGAAVHDFINIATRRWPPIKILVYPVAVQGERAPGEIMEAIRNLNALNRAEVIVLCRGGGSIEDLWAFNDELLAREIRSSTIPVVSAVGHEIDFTIADFAADLRAPTPSAAAELITPDGAAFAENISRSSSRLHHALQRQIRDCEHRLKIVSAELRDLPHPLDAMLLKIGQLSMSIEHGMNLSFQQKDQRLQILLGRLTARNPANSFPLYERRIMELQERLVRACKGILERGERRIAVSAGVLDAVSPLATLARGYAIAQKSGVEAKIIKDASQVQEGERISLRLHRGGLRCTVDEVIEHGKEHN